MRFEEYVAARWVRLVRSAVLMGADPHTAEDLAQTTLLRCQRRWDRVARAHDPDAYVHRVLINCLTDSRRRRWWGERPTEVLPDGPSIAAGPDEVADRDAVRAALRRLPRGQREVLVLRFYADLSEAQTAETLRVAPGTVKSRASRGLAALEADPTLHELSPGGER